MEDLTEVPEDFDGKVNCESFWGDITTEIISRAFLKGKTTYLYFHFSGEKTLDLYVITETI